MKGGRDTRQWMLWAFKLHGCEDCGISYPDIPMTDLHCHHRDPSQKVLLEKSNLFGGGGLSSVANRGTHDLFLEELGKCDVLCNPCHRARHRNGNGEVHHEQLLLFGGTGETKVTEAWNLL